MRRQEGGGGAAPAGKPRKLALGRSRDPTGGHYDPSAGSSAGLGLAGMPRARKRGPGVRNRRHGAPRGARVFARRARASQSAAKMGAMRRSIPSGLSRGTTKGPASAGKNDGVPRAAKNRGSEALAFLRLILRSPPKRQRRRASRRMKAVARPHASRRRLRRLLSMRRNAATVESVPHLGVSAKASARPRQCAPCAIATVPASDAPSENDNTMSSGFCRNSPVTAWRTVAASSRRGLAS